MPILGLYLLTQEGIHTVLMTPLRGFRMDQLPPRWGHLPLNKNLKSDALPVPMGGGGGLELTEL